MPRTVKRLARHGDPVQSMDEVHISQFAALLRTLSKKHGRQVIIAVHENLLHIPLAYLYCEDDELAGVIAAWSRLSRPGRGKLAKAVTNRAAPDPNADRWSVD